MNAAQLLQQIKTNRDLILNNNMHAYEHLQMLKNDYKHLIDEQVSISLELNQSLADLYFYSNYEAAIKNSLAVLNKYPNSVHRSLINGHLKVVGRCYTGMGEFKLAEKSLLEALSFTTDLTIEHTTNRADTLHALAMNQEMIEEGSAKSIAYLSEAIELLSNKEYAVRQANCKMGLGNVYNNAEKVEEALKYYTAAADTFEAHYVLSNMASAYSNIGNCHIKLHDLDKAEKFHQKAFELRLKFASPDDLSISYYNLAVVSKEKGDFDKAESFLIKSREILERIGNKPYLAEVNDRIAELKELRRNSAEIK